MWPENNSPKIHTAIKATCVRCLIICGVNSEWVNLCKDLLVIFLWRGQELDVHNTGPLPAWFARHKSVVTEEIKHCDPLNITQFISWAIKWIYGGNCASWKPSARIKYCTLYFSICLCFFHISRSILDVSFPRCNHFYFLLNQQSKRK